VKFLFNAMDKDSSGSISLQEFVTEFQSLNGKLISNEIVQYTIDKIKTLLKSINASPEVIFDQNSKDKEYLNIIEFTSLIK
jgi:hypothetical protein